MCKMCLYIASAIHLPITAKRVRVSEAALEEGNDTKWYPKSTGTKGNQ